MHGKCIQALPWKNCIAKMRHHNPIGIFTFLLPLHMGLHAPLAAALPSPGLPMVINTWGGPFTAATDAAYLALTGNTTSTATAIDAVQLGCSTCERNRCDGSVGYGGSPDEACETTLDALLMDGTTLNAGAVAGLRRVRDAAAAARLVLDRTEHTMLSGDLATRFAVDFGGLAEDVTEGDLGSPESRASCAAWREAGCQPNYWTAGAVVPDPALGCGPYLPAGAAQLSTSSQGYTEGSEAAVPDTQLKSRAAPAYATSAGRSHDTISMVAIHADGSMAAGTSTNGASHKIPGRVGDGPIPGSGSYVDGEVGGCGATGDGDIMMRFLPCYQAVESMRRGMTPQEAADDAVGRMVRRYPGLSSGIVVVNAQGEYGGAASGWTFTYSVRGGAMNETQVVTVQPLSD